MLGFIPIFVWGGGTWIGVWIFLTGHLGGGGGGGGLLFYNFLWGWGWLALEFLGDKFDLFFFTFFLDIFKTFFPFFLFRGGTLLIFVQHSLIYSHNFFHVLLGSVGRCAFWGVFA